MDDKLKNCIIVCYKNDEYKNKAQEIANFIGANITTFDNANTKLKLVVDDSVYLTDGTNTLKGDYLKLKNRLRIENLRAEDIVKACKIKGQVGGIVLDATAGLGEDSLLLSAFGFKVELFEKNPIIFCLLKDTIDRAMLDDDLKIATKNMSIHYGDSIEFMKNKTLSPDIVFLDPMFPERQKSALVKKKFQLLHLIQNPCDDEKILLDTALNISPKKIVIKRPNKGNYLDNKKPTYSINGKSIRYDCFCIIH